ncbi:hypothetical protein J3R83DRAFT_8925 [Lanmaoa asiatica]|nr:hypothetical protein J3R83DRAFT_8925 [Lanmaoa asiatica]
MLALSINLHCNNDCKLIRWVRHQKPVILCSFIISNQKAGEKLQYFCSDGDGHHLKRSSNANYVEGLCDQQRLLLFRLVHAINQQQELAAPMVMSYIMGWGDVVRSHHYSPIYWSSFVRILFAQHPSLQEVGGVTKMAESIPAHHCDQDDGRTVVSPTEWLYLRQAR